MHLGLLVQYICCDGLDQASKNSVVTSTAGVRDQTTQCPPLTALSHCEFQSVLSVWCAHVDFHNMYNMYI